nr:MAG TPA: hypothetical protein [Microviridae sp.]
MILTFGVVVGVLARWNLLIRVIYMLFFLIALLMKIGIKQVVLVSFRCFEEVRLWPSACVVPRIGRYFAIPLSIRSEST